MNRMIPVFLIVAALHSVGCKPSSPAHIQTDLTILKNAPLPADWVKLAKTDHVALLQKARDEYTQRGVRDLTCTLIKQERLGGSLGKVQHMEVKFTPKPFRVAMRWTKNAPIGKAFVFVEGQYKDKKGRSRMVVGLEGVIGFLGGGYSLRRPDEPEVMKNTLRPCTKFGFANSFQSLLEVYELARSRKQGSEKFLGGAEVNGKPCLVLQRTLPKNKDYPAAKTLICIDAESHLPTRVIGYDWDGQLICNYEFRNLKFNTGLDAKDFTPKANGIKTPKESSSPTP